ncbi:MAG: response regulator transcription factor [Planctomycetes bacterium]|nr:response regulator transcription factor [Planctomycetota bacterium]
MLVQTTTSTAPGLSNATAPIIRVVDDESAIQALFERIGQLCGFEVDCHSTAESFLNAFEDERPGCLVIDLMLPDRSGIEVLQEVTRRGCELPVVFMSGMARVSEAVQALKLGSIDFVEKPFDVQQIAEVLRRAVDLDLRRRQQGQDLDELRRRFDSLTRREGQVMEQIVRGAANKEVAASLGLSHKTVEVHRANVMRKTQAGSLAELVRMHVAANSVDQQD